MAKVGRSVRPPEERAAELSHASGVATPFVLVFEQAFADCAEAERKIHAELDRRALRVAPNREFFRGPVADIVRIILDLASRSDTAPTIEDHAGALLRSAEDHWHGRGQALQDPAEALRLYRLAARAGALLAFERLGVYHAQQRERVSSNRRRALEYFREGASRGNYYCLAEMAWLYATERHQANFEKCWTMFFAAAAGPDRRPELEGGDRLVLACRQYLAACLDLGWTPTHEESLRPVRRELTASLDGALAEPGLPAAVRGRLLVMRDWALHHLMPEPVAANDRRSAGPRRIVSWLSSAGTGHGRVAAGAAVAGA